MITNKRLHYLLTYDLSSGVFRWKNPNRGKAMAGQIINGWMQGKYLSVGLDSQRYKLHRLAWFYVYGRWPKQIDHANGNRFDNRISNLRECTNSQNSANMFGRGKSGLKGTYYEKRSKRYYALICKDYKRINLGTFDTKEEAHATYAKAAKKLFGEFARVK